MVIGAIGGDRAQTTGKRLEAQAGDTRGVAPNGRGTTAPLKRASMVDTEAFEMDD